MHYHRQTANPLLPSLQFFQILFLMKEIKQALRDHGTGFGIVKLLPGHIPEIPYTLTVLHQYTCQMTST